MKEARRRHCVVQAGTKAYILGGYNDDDKTLDMVEVFDLNNQQFSDKPKLLILLEEMSAVTVWKYIVVVGGRDDCTDNSNPNMFLFDTEE